jgi:FlaA1/EpsC-like NDP-sugar epimerase
MLDLAKVISDDIEIVGKRPGEKRDEDLISEREISRTFIYDDDIHIKAEHNTGVNRLFEPYNSASADKMCWEEMLEMVSRC